jgi:Secretion system C-terminal sorting domain/Beta-propeller repeat
MRNLLLGSLLISVLMSQEILWLRRYDRGTDERGQDVILDGSGNLIVAGYSWNITNDGYDIFFIKYTPSGDTIWTKYYDSGESECVSHIALELQGNIIAAGWGGNDSIEAQCLLVKFSPDGNFLWQREYRIGDQDFFCDVAIYDSSIILAGFSYTYSGSGLSTGFLRKYNSQGKVLWTKFFPWAWEFYSMTVTADGSFFVTGRDTSWQMLTVRFDSLGDSIWTRRYSYFISGGCGITSDIWGNIIVAGYIGNGILYDCEIIKYTSAGGTIWTRRVDFTPHDWATNVATDEFGNIYVSANTGVNDTSDYLLLKYNSSGDTIWTGHYDNGYNDVAYGVVVDDNDNPIVTGMSSNGTDYDVVTIKYRGTSGIEEHQTPDAKRFASEIYPNPAKSLLAVRLPLTADRQNLKIFDVSGKLIKIVDKVTNIQSHKQEVKISLKGINPGIYFLRLDKETKKFLIVK